MSTSGAYVNSPLRRNAKIRAGNALGIGSIRPVKKSSVQVAKQMKLTIKQRFRNWLMDDSRDEDYAESLQVRDEPNIRSHGFQMHVYTASGGTIVETTKYDRKNDENRHSLHVVTDDKDLGEELAKIITMESLR